MNFSFSDGVLYFLPLGGADEIGMNLNLFGYNNRWIIVDCGVTFNDRFGVEVIAPDLSAIAMLGIKVDAFVITHAHEDHIGAIPYVWPQFECPVYATPFTASILREKIEERDFKNRFILHEVPLCGKIKIGDFDIEYVTITHSIPEPNALVIDTPVGRIVHTGDWKIDPDPLVGEVTNAKRLIEVGDEGVLALICDSTNVFCNGESGSEASVRKELTSLIGRYPNNRITVSCFASNVARVETIAVAAQQCGRKVALLGRSLYRMVEAAQKNGYLKGVSNFIDDRQIRDYKDHQVLIISTGSQGEPRSALARIASDQHPLLRMNENDVVIFSSRVIPGNEKVIAAMQNRLVRKRVEIVTSKEEDIHVSGHPSRGDLKKMYEWIRPEIVVPVHGEARHLYEQASLARSLGVSKIVVPHNGAIIELSREKPSIVATTHAGRCFWEGGRLVPSTNAIFRDRMRLSVDGAIFLTVFLSQSGQVTRNAHVTILGLEEAGRRRDDLVLMIQKQIRTALKGHFKRHDEREIALRQSIRRLTMQRLSKKPMVEVHFVQG